MRECQLLVINYILSLMSVTLTKPEFMKRKSKEKNQYLLNICLTSTMVFLEIF